MLRSTELVGRVIGTRYRLMRPVGSGASAHVYVAEDVRLRRRVAIKVLHPALAQDRAFLLRFQAEAQTVAALRHPSILRVYDWGEDDGDAYLVMELLEGGSLRSLLDTGGRLSISQAAALGLDVSSALAHAHSRGLVHRDIKPANLLFDDEGHASVADFGIARALAEASWTEPWGAMVGTARYAAPEQLRAVALDGRADVYALAIVLVEAVTGTVPFALDTTLGALIARADQPLPVPPELGPLAPVLAAAGTGDPQERLTAEALAAAIAGVATTLRAPKRLLLPGLRAPAGEVVVEERTEMGRPHLGPPAGPGLTVLEDRVALGQATSAQEPLSSGGTVWLDEAPTVPPLAATATQVPAPGAANQLPVVADAPPTASSAGTSSASYEGPAGGAVPKKRRRALKVVAALVALVLLAGGGAAAYVLSQPPPKFALPSVMGDRLAGARSALSGHRWRLRVGQRAWDSAPSGTIVGQRPMAGTKELAREVVTVTVSKGPRPVAVPSLASLTLARAQAVLAQGGLKAGEVSHNSSMTVPAGAVVSWSDAGKHLLPGSKVNLVVSTGKPVVVVPAIGSATANYALMSAALTKMGLHPVESLVYSDTVTNGYVISTYPAGGDSEVVGTTVTVTVSKGRHMVVVPANIVNLTAGQAASVLEADGLYDGGVQGDVLEPVTGSIPAVGTSVPYHSSVTLLTG